MAKVFLQYPSGIVAIMMLVVLMIEGSRARQTRINRYTTEVVEDNNYVAASSPSSLEALKASRGRKSAPYPAAGYRPGRAFRLPTEEEVEAGNAGPKAGDQYAVPETTTEFAEPTTTTTETIEQESTTFAASDLDGSIPRIAPYPAAGYRPNKPFNLPTEDQTSNKDNEVPAPRALGEPSALISNDPNEADSDDVTTATTPKDSEAHPACGVREDKMPKMSDDTSQDDPDSERIVIPAPVNYQPFGQLRSQPIIAQPIEPFFLVHRRPFAYSAQLQTW